MPPPVRAARGGRALRCCHGLQLRCTAEARAEERDARRCGACPFAFSAAFALTPPLGTQAPGCGVQGPLAVPPEEYATLLHQHVSPTLGTTAEDATVAARVFAVNSAFDAMLRDGDDLESQLGIVHDAIFALGQMAVFVELRPMLASRGVEEALLRLDVHAQQGALQPQHREKILAIQALLEQHVLWRPPMLHLGGAPAEGMEDHGAQLFRTFGPLHQVDPVLVPMTDRCSACGTAATTGGVKLRRCARCMDARYCDAACQRRHWAVHKTQCSPKTGE